MTQKMIRKRDGRLVKFHTEKIRNAIWRSFLGVGQTGIARVDAGHIRVRLLAEKQPPFACRPLAPELEDVYLHYFGAEDGL